MATVKTLIKYIDGDLVFGRVLLMVGTEFRTINVSEYRQLTSYANQWQSGLERVFRKTHPATVLYFNEKNALRAEGQAMARIIKRMLGL